MTGSSVVRQIRDGGRERPVAIRIKKNTPRRAQKSFLAFQTYDSVDASGRDEDDAEEVVPSKPRMPVLPGRESVKGSRGSRRSPAEGAGRSRCRDEGRPRHRRALGERGGDGARLSVLTSERPTSVF